MKIHKIKNYHKQASVIAELSHDLETQVGAILINSKTGAVISSGYNGFIREASDEKLPKTRPDKYEYMVHAETNLIYNCARHGISMSDCFVYCTLSPCMSCLRALYQSGIKRIIFKDRYKDFHDESLVLDLGWQILTCGEFTIILLRAK